MSVSSFLPRKNSSAGCACAAEIIKLMAAKTAGNRISAHLAIALSRRRVRKYPGSSCWPVDDLEKGAHVPAPRAHLVRRHDATSIQVRSQYRNLVTAPRCGPL